VRKNLALLVCSLALCALLGELAVRMIHPALLLEDERLILTSAPYLADANGAVRYPPHLHVRASLLSPSGIEFDVRFQTNDLGLVDPRDSLPVPASGRRYAFVGNSYTAGVEGGRPWVPRLRDARGLAAFNLGIGATGVQHFAKLLESLDPLLHFTDIAIVAISDDFFRPAWRPLVEGSESRICAPEEDTATCRARPPIAYLIPPDIPASQLIDYARQRRLARAARPRGRAGLRASLKSSRLLLFGKRFVEQSVLRRLQRSAVLPANLEALSRIRRRFPAARIGLVHLPDKAEVGRGRYSLALSDHVRSRGIEYFPALERCPWSPDMFYRHDNHPTAAGYENVSRCVETFLDL